MNPARPDSQPPFNPQTFMDEVRDESKSYPFQNKDGSYGFEPRGWGVLGPGEKHQAFLRTVRIFEARKSELESLELFKGNKALAERQVRKHSPHPAEKATYLTANDCKNICSDANDSPVANIQQAEIMIVNAVLNKKADEIENAVNHLSTALDQHIAGHGLSPQLKKEFLEKEQERLARLVLAHASKDFDYHPDEEVNRDGLEILSGFGEELIKADGLLTRQPGPNRAVQPDFKHVRKIEKTEPTPMRLSDEQLALQAYKLAQAEATGFEDKYFKLAFEQGLLPRHVARAITSDNRGALNKFIIDFLPIWNQAKKASNRQASWANDPAQTMPNDATERPKKKSVNRPAPKPRIRKKEKITVSQQVGQPNINNQPSNSGDKKETIPELPPFILPASQLSDEELYGPSEITPKDQEAHMMSLMPTVTEGIEKERQEKRVPLEETERRLFAQGLISDPFEFTRIRQAWGESDLLNQPDFSNQYTALLSINRMLGGLHEQGLCQTLKPLEYADMAYIQKTGILNQYYDEILAAWSNEQPAEPLVKRLFAEYGVSLKEMDPALAEKNLHLAGVPMHNWGQNCWVNASLKLMFELFSDVDIAVLEKQEYPSVLENEGQYKTALRDAFVAAWKEQKAMRGSGNPHVLTGHQRKIMSCLYDLGQHDPLNGAALKEVFNRPLPPDQHDASSMLGGLMIALGLEQNPRFGLALRTHINGRWENKMLSRPSQSENNPQLILPIASRLNGLELLAQTLIDEGRRQLENTTFQTAQQNELKDRVLRLNDEVTRTDSPDQVRAIRDASGALEQAVESVVASVAKPDALIVARVGDEGQDLCLLEDCVLENGRVIRRGEYLLHHGRINNIPHCIGETESDQGTLFQPESGELLMSYRLGDQQYVKGVAVLNNDGTLAYPYLTRPTNIVEQFEPFPRLTLPVGSPVLSSKGAIMQHGYLEDGRLGIREHNIIDPELVQLIRANDFESMGSEDRKSVAKKLAGMLGLGEQSLDARQLQRLTQPVTLENCLGKYAHGEKNEFNWTDQELEQQGIGKNAIQAKKGGNRGDVRLPGQLSYSLEADFTKLRRFVVSFSMFESKNNEQKKRAGHAKEAFLNGCFPNITLPVTDTQTGQASQVEGRLKSMVCHSGSANAGHYINISFPENGQPIIHDDRIVLNLQDYLAFRDWPAEWGIEDIIQQTGFTPYIGLFERGATRR